MQLLACVLIGQEQTSAKINSVFAIAELYLNTSNVNLNSAAITLYKHAARQKMPPQVLPRQQMPKATFSQPYISIYVYEKD